MRNWLLFYSLPVLNGVLPNPYLSHHSLLVAGLLLLTSDQISQDDLRNAELYLKEFYVKYPELYGKCIQYLWVSPLLLSLQLLLHVPPHLHSLISPTSLSLLVSPCVSLCLFTEYYIYIG